MAILYNCMHSGDQYRITKFDDLGNPESSYLVDHEACECPAGVRPSCRHRDMLPLFIKRDAVDSFFFLDWDRKGWVMNEPAAQAHSSEPLANALDHFLGPHSVTASTSDFESESGGSTPPVAAKPSWRRH